jgi:hypothetical protein
MQAKKASVPRADLFAQYSPLRNANTQSPGNRSSWTAAALFFICAKVGSTGQMRKTKK